MDWDLTSSNASTQSNKQLHTVSATKVLLYRKQGNKVWVKIIVDMEAADFSLFIDSVPSHTPGVHGLSLAKQPVIALPPEVLQFSYYFSKKEKS